MPGHWNLNDLFAPPRTFPAPGFERPGVEALFFENERYKGKGTRVFAYMGLPYLKEGQTCPAMVLLHGGGGTAFDEWVRIWNRRGYAAIVFDQCGCVPERPVPVGGRPHERHDNGGPAGWNASFERVNDPLEDQWQYHAVAAALRAHSLLASRPGVDPERVGVTGISWGGYLTGLVAGTDSRLKCAVPVYGCGFLGNDSVWKDTVFPSMSRADIRRWLTLWDPAEYLPHARMPFCWVSGTNDFAYPLDSLQSSYRLTGSGRVVCVRVEMPHGHEDGWAPEEIGIFADWILKDGVPPTKITEFGIESGKVKVGYESVRPVMRAELNCTRAIGCWNDRKYRILPVEVDPAKGQIEADLPPRTTACFFNLFDDRDCVVSTEHLDLSESLLCPVG